MSNIGDVKMKLAGTLGLDDGGEATVNDLSDLVVTWQKDAADAAAGDATNTCIFRNKLSCDLRVVAAEYIPDATLTAHDTNYATLSLQVGTVGSFAAAASQTTKITGGSGDWAADTPEALTLSSTPANLVVDAGDILQADIAKANSGVAVPAGVLVVHLRRQ